MEDCSTVSETLVPGCSPCSESISAQSVGVAVPLTAGDDLATFRTLAAGEPGGIP